MVDLVIVNSANESLRVSEYFVADVFDAFQVCESRVSIEFG